MRIVSASMAMSCVADAIARIDATIQNVIPAGGTMPRSAIVAMRRTSASWIHRLYVPHKSTAGAQRTFAVHANPIALKSPIFVAEIPCTLR